MSKHSKPKHAKPKSDKPTKGLQLAYPHEPTPGKPLAKSNQDPTKGLRDALKLKDVEDLAMQVAELTGGS